ncbi:hypothetical protein BC939DRAFT_458854 [Gamsiella multidivaricata]|uniref:uncharacterized protein n=1 Tax=Gamsiella multidivaricata TaxID=101098 RepID=UPI00221E8A27|nr:uncharacterized protein BC939DRAFT_458854 [Gamsiella multidivaricata]KAI7820069.1 hypothetical protein BC939DRAFT_458854 [Gamsiella multidivaricata]
MQYILSQMFAGTFIIFTTDAAPAPTLTLSYNSPLSTVQRIATSTRELNPTYSGKPLLHRQYSPISPYSYQTYQASSSPSLNTGK